MAEQSKSLLLKKIENSLSGIRPYLQADGGDIEVVELTDDLILRVKLIGACETCSLSYMTMKAGVEQSIKKDIPEIVKIEAINLVTENPNQVSI